MSQVFPTLALQQRGSAGTL